MPEGVTPADPGLLSSVANFISLPGQVIRNRLSGRDDASLRNLGDLLGDTVDAVLPGDWIPEFSGPEDRTDTRQMLKSWGTDLPEGLPGDILSFAGDVATDPTTYVPGAVLAKGAGLAAKGVKAVTPKVIQEGVAKVAAPVGKALRKIAGAERIGKPLADVITAAQGAKENAARASQDYLVEGLKGATPRELDAATEVLTNVARDKATGAARVIDETETLSVQDRLARYLTENPDVDPERMMRIVTTGNAVGKGQRASGLAGNIFTEGGNLSEDYFPRLMKSDEADDLAEELIGQPSAIAARKLTTAKDLAAHLTAHPEIQMANAAEALGKRGASQGELAGRGAAGKGLMEMAREGGMELPDELLMKALAAQRAAMPAKAVVGPSDEGIDVMAMLGGRPSAKPPQPFPAAKPAAPTPAPESPIAAPASGVESIRRSAAERASKTADEIDVEASAIDRAAAADAERILGKEKAAIWMKGRVGEEWLEKLKDSGYFGDLPPSTAFGSPAWDAKFGPLVNKYEDTKPLRQFAQKIREMEQARSAEDIGVILGGRIPDIVRANAKDPAEWTMAESAAVSLYRAAQRAAVKSGIGPKEVEDQIASYAQKYGYTPWQLEDLAAANKPGSAQRADDLISSGPTKQIGYEPPVVAASPTAPDVYGLGTQSGKSVVGKSTAPTPSGLSDVDRKSARDWLLSQEYKVADPLLKETAEAIAKNLPGDEADVALHLLKGMKGRTGLPKALASLNHRFKPVAVYGALVPKLGSITRNMTGGIWQKYSNPEARGVISPKNIPNFMRDWLASIEDGFERLTGKRVFTKNEFKEIDEAFKAGGGDPRQALSLIKDPTMRAAASKGVFGNNFVDTEGLIAQAGKTGLRKFGESLYDYPGYMFKGAEQRMRYGLFKQLKAAGKSDDDAARIVRDSFYDYTQSSVENRLARDVIPFAQFMFKSIPQQAKLMAEKPALASGVANLYAQGRDEPVLPHMEGKINFPTGYDEMGNRQYLTGLGLPFESLSTLPNLSASPLQAGRDVEQNIVGATSPLLKAAYAYTSGRDPMFGTAPGSYTKVAGQDLGKAGGVINQLLGTGLGPATAAQQLAGQVGKFSDARTSLPELALNQLTGARIQSVDPDRAIQQRLQALLERDPSIGQFRTFFSKGEDDTTAEGLLEALQNAKQSLKAKQKALVPVN